MNAPNSGLTACMKDKENDNNSENKGLQKHDKSSAKEGVQDWWIEQMRKKVIKCLTTKACRFK